MDRNTRQEFPSGRDNQYSNGIGESDDAGALPSQALAVEPVPLSSGLHSVPQTSAASMRRPGVMATSAFPSMPQSMGSPMPQSLGASRLHAAAPSVPQSAAAASMPRSMGTSFPQSGVAPMPRSAATSMPRPATGSPRSVATAQPASNPSAATPSGRSPVVIERENFLVFIKILFKILEDAKETETKSKAQRIVMECRRRSKQGDPNFNPMMEAVERRLRHFVGEARYRRAHLLLHHYITNKPPRMNTAIRPQPTALCAGK